MWRELFYFRKSDRRLFLTLLVAAAVALAVAWVAGSGADTSDGGPLDVWPAGNRQAASRTAGSDAPALAGAPGTTRRAELFEFDPNTADSTQLLRLGLSRWQVRAVYRYRAAGGVYSRPTDFARLYGLTVRQYREMEPYIRIAHDFTPASSIADAAQATAATAAPAGTAARDTMRYPVKLSAGQRIPLNTSDTTALRKVPGIGAYYARRIARYRERLGGFYSVGQLSEIEGLPVDVGEYFTVDAAHVRRMNINKLSLEQLRRHPYINYYQARDIVDFRRLRGPISDLRQLRLLKSFGEADFERLAHYVEY